MPNAQIQNQAGKAISALRASPGRSSVLGGLVLILVIAWMRVLIGGKANTSSAQAASVTPASASDAAPLEVKTEGSNGTALLQWIHQGNRRQLSRNPFVVPLDFYPTDAGSVAEESAAGNSYWDLLRKSMASRADQQEQRQILIDNVRIAAESLKLESTIMGATPGAMVNGQMVHEGSVINGFRVVRIESRQLTLEREGIKLAVMMN
jgi:hypothetical protein